MTIGGYEREAMLAELRQLTDPATLRTAEESAEAYARAREICDRVGAMHPEDVEGKLFPTRVWFREREERDEATCRDHEARFASCGCPACAARKPGC